MSSTRPDALSATVTPVYLAASDPRAATMIADLADVYGALYGPGAHDEMTRYPADLFDPPQGAFMLLMHDDVAVAGGAFMSHSAGTAEFKRIWTHADHRRQGLSRRVLAELESEAARRGYVRVFLTTGPRQPEAIALYRSTGYTPLFDVHADPERIGLHSFEKMIGSPPADQPLPPITPPVLRLD
ncbi:N-acetyltransferase [Tersicoccus solisilvae]|uniref:N-acetyltransferase n=1 Tax=Tersicoccus solisilvae TaxID=1882339 RepID=A0ABQ1NMR6_9MICC|nr:GNAT family N-acetyltransferase [Tersicoccus solisilvae]GGC81017.1 N-acetyltransferase [Tersicoccus solisilvae]